MKPYVKPILVGALLGAALFAAPFLVLRVAFVLFLIGFAFRLFHFWRFRRGLGHSFAFADRIRSMTDEEYADFKGQFQSRAGHCRAHRTSENQTL